MTRIELGPAGRAVAANVKRLRAERGLSLKALSDALERQGRHLGEDALGKIEKGARVNGVAAARRVDADDLAALAVVLGVAPSDLLRPPAGERDGSVDGVSRLVRHDG